MARRKIISEEEREFVREVFEWLKTSGVERGFVRKDWKNWLVDYIWEELRREGKEVKRESVRRNVNRMIAYYYNTGAQARSGAQYLKYIERYIKGIEDNMRMMGGLETQHFLTTEEARLYRGEITALHDIPNWHAKMITVYRYYLT